jgi:hypothetical protein
MMKRNLFIAFVLVLLAPSLLSAREDRTRRGGTNLPNTLIVDYKPAFNVNEVFAWVSNDANLFQTNLNGPGFFFPAGSNSTAIFLMSPWLACQYEGDQSLAGLRTAAVQNIGRNGTEFQPGRLLPRPDGTISAEDPTAPKNRVYVIRSGDDANSNPDFRNWPFTDGAPYRTLENFNGLADSFAVQNPQPGVDLPIALDVNNTPLIINSQADIVANVSRLVPKLIGSVTAWCVYNDFKRPRSFSSFPIGCEIQQTAFAFSTSGARGRAVFFKFKITNRNIPVQNQPVRGLWQNTYFAIFNDNDLGEAGDDLVGVDTLRSLGYTYNATNNDIVYGAAPPAVGVDYFQGPFVRQNVPFTGTPRPVEVDLRDSVRALVGGLSINIPNPRKNLPATKGASAHIRFNNPGTGGSPDEGDPEGGRPDHVYNFMRGRNRVGQTLGGTLPGSGFMFPGDPETGSGILEPVATASDKRQLIVTGPFDMFAGEVQEIVIGVHIARGSSNVISVTRLKEENTAIQAAYDANFKVPTPITPNLTVTQLSNEIILSWTDFRPDAQSYTPRLEGVPLNRPGSLPQNTDDRYFFQGYNVYQYETVAGRSNAAARFRKIATFDLADGFGALEDFSDITVDGQRISVVRTVQNGRNTGIERTLRIRNNLLDGETAPLNNGTRYFYAVTAYYLNPFLLRQSPFPTPPTNRPIREDQAVLESLERIVTAVPQAPVTGTVLPSATGETIQTNRLREAGDDNVKVTVLDPTKMKQRRYRVAFLDSSITLWQLRDAGADTIFRTVPDGRRLDSLNVIRLLRPTQYLPETLQVDERRNNPPVIDGIQVLVRQNILGLRADNQGGVPPLQYKPALNRWFEPKEASFAIAPDVGGSRAALQNASTNFNSNGISDGGTICYPTRSIFGNSPAGTNTRPEDILPVEIEFTDDPNLQQFAHRYVSNIQRTPGFFNPNTRLIVGDSSFRRFIDTSAFIGPIARRSAQYSSSAPFQNLVKIPLRAFEINPGTGQRLRQLHILFTERNDTDRNAKAFGFAVDGQWRPTTSSHGGGEILFITRTTYNPNATNQLQTRYAYSGNPADSIPLLLETSEATLDIMYAFWVKRQINIAGEARDFRNGDIIDIIPNYKIAQNTVYEFSTEGVKLNERSAGQDRLAKINVFPNPYFGASRREQNLRQTIVTFNNLPQRCRIKIYTLNGDFVRKIERDNPNTSLEDWNLRNFANIPVASGMYLVHIETEFGSKVLKLAVVAREEREDSF